MAPYDDNFQPGLHLVSNKQKRHNEATQAKKATSCKHTEALDCCC